MSDVSDEQVLNRMSSKTTRKSVPIPKPVSTTSAKKGTSRCNKRDSAIGDYFQASPRPKKTPPSPAPAPNKRPAQDRIELDSDGDVVPQGAPQSSGKTVQSTSSKSIKATPNKEALEEPSDEEEPRGHGKNHRDDEDSSESDDDVPDDFGAPRGARTVVKVDNDDEKRNAHSSTSLPVNRRKTGNAMDIFSVSDDEEHNSSVSGGTNTRSEAFVQCLSKLLTRSGVQDARTRTMLKEMNGMRSILEDIMFKVSTVESYVEGNGTNKAGAGGNKKGTKKSLGGIAGWEKLMVDTFPHLDCFFPPALWKEAILSSVFEHIHSTTSCEYGRYECILAISGVLFARKNHGKKCLFDTDVGKSASAFRKLILRKLIKLARAKKYPPLKPRGDVELDENPEWLGKWENEMYIEEEHIQAGQVYHESKASNTPEYNRRIAVGNGAEPRRKDFASYIMIHLYDVMNHLFIERRKRVRSEFCESFGYLFHSWSKVKDVYVKESTIRLAWKVPFEDIVKVPPEALREAETDDKEGKSADRANKLIFDCVARNKELWLFVVHDVILSKGVNGADGKRKIPGEVTDTPRLFRRWTNMLAPACEFFMALAGVDDGEPSHHVMRYHKKSTTVLYHVGLFLRDVYDLHQSRDIFDGFDNASRKVIVSERDWKKITDFYDIFNTTDGGNDKAVVNATCAVHETEYDTKHKFTKAERQARARVLKQQNSDMEGSTNEAEGSRNVRSDDPGTAEPSSGKAPTKCVEKDSVQSIAPRSCDEGSRAASGNADGVEEDAIAQRVKARVGTLQLDDADDADDDDDVVDDAVKEGGNDDDDGVEAEDENVEESDSEIVEKEKRRAPGGKSLIVPHTRRTIGTDVSAEKDGEVSD